MAEGVETAQQAAIVREFECDAAQGYFFAPPLSIEVATELANEPGFCFSMEGAGWADHKFDATGRDDAGRPRAVPSSSAGQERSPRPRRPRRLRRPDRRNC